MVAVQARGRDQRGQPLDEFQRRQPQSRAAIGLGLGKAIDELVVTDLLEALQREGRARTCCCTAARSSGVSAPASAKRTCPSLARGEHPVDHAAVEVDMGIQCGPEALHEAHRPQPPATATAALTQPRFDDA